MDVLQRPSCSRLTTCTKATKEGTILKNCANDLFYATSVQQGELITRQDCESLTTRTVLTLKSSSSAWV